MTSQNCVACGQPTERHPGIEGDPDSDDFVCRSQSCELVGIPQPSRTKARWESITLRASDVVFLWRNAPPSQNEENLIPVRDALSRALVGFDVSIIDTKRDGEHGEDIRATCARCHRPMGVQVTRDLNGLRAAERRAKEYVWHTEPLAPLLRRVVKRVRDKRTNAGRHEMILALDASETFWPTVLSSHRAQADTEIGNEGWMAVAAIASTNVRWIGGPSPKCACRTPK